MKHGKHEAGRNKKPSTDHLRTQMLEGLRELIVGVILILLEMLIRKLST